MRAALVAGFALCSGCSSLLGIDDFHMTDAAVIDTPSLIDAPMADAQVCFGTLTRVCLPSAPTGTVIIAGNLDTASDPRCITIQDANAGFLCVIAGGNLSIEATQVTGSRPLVLVAASSITLNAAIDAGSTRAGKLGPAARATPCVATQNGASGSEAGGGAGGSFGSAGGKGGDGVGGNLGGPANPTTTVSFIRGGCGGGAGGTGSIGSSGAAGPSGGAIALYAGSQIAITTNGAVFASGGGGGPANSSGSKGGGGGGGSGGLIVLEAPAIQILGTVAANGAGGGGSGDGGPGQPGADGSTFQFSSAALGGAAQASDRGGDGGNGAALTAGAQPVDASPGSGGGGGGGGGTGIIWIKGIVANVGGNKLSPTPELH